MRTLKNYLEMVSTADFRAKMAAAGLEPNTSIGIESTDVPDFVLSDAGWFPDDEVREELGPNVKKGLANVLGENIFDTRKKPLDLDIKYRVRVVVTPDTILWGSSSDCIHGEIVAYGMCTNRIPMEESLSDYKWRNNTHDFKEFICFEYFHKGTYPWSTAESYTLSEDEMRTGLKLSQYKEIFKTLNIDPNEVIINTDGAQ